MDLDWLWLIIPAAYILLSTFFFWFPTILHKKHVYKYPPFNDLIQGEGVFCIGHRGGGWEGPENTIQLFSKNDSNVHMFELDVCLTKDKKLVVHHDATLDRTCGKQYYISETNYQDLPCFKEEFQSFGGPMMKTNKNKIPLLEQIFEKFPEKPMNIQLKTPSTEAIEEFSRLVNKYDRQSYTIWGIAGSMNQQLRNHHPNTVNFYSAGQTLQIYTLFLFGLLPFACLRQGVLDIPLITDDFYRMAMRFADSGCKKCLFGFVFLILKCFNCLSWFFIRHLKRRGILTFYFILNHQEDFDSALSKGCSGIMTDLTRDLKIYLQNLGRYYNSNHQSRQINSRFQN